VRLRIFSSRVLWLLPVLAGLVLGVGALVRLGAPASASTRERASLAPHSPQSRWITTWGASAQAATSRGRFTRGFADQTIRNIIFATAAGTRVRVEITNAFGTRPLRVGAASFGLARAGAGLAPSSIVRLSFGGHRAVVIPPGQTALSDAVTAEVMPLRRYAVTIYLPRHTGPPTLHGLARQVNYVAAGDHAFDADAGKFTGRSGSWYFVDRVDVLNAHQGAGTIVTLGDSITDGVGSPAGANARWPNDLARRLDTQRRPALGVVDEGIGGNRVLHGAPCCGIDAVRRFRTDVATLPGVRVVILLEGINDIGFSRARGRLNAPHTPVSASQIIAGYLMIISKAHAAGLKIIGGTLTPFRGSRYWSPAGEAERQAVNRWILTGGAFDGVIDFARVLADPVEPERLDPRYDSGDHLHPNGLGYQAMANAIPLARLMQR
jgi:lysophospholipase L1-like esterase